MLSLADCTLVDVDSHVGERVIEDLLPYVRNEGVRPVIADLDSKAAVATTIFSSTWITPGFAQIMASDASRAATMSTRAPTVRR